MRILMVGAGALGGYFGGRLLEAGADVTFLVRPRRAAQLAASGLCVRSPFGDITIDAPACVAREAVGGPFDLVVVGCKAFDLPDTMTDMAPAVGPETTVLPLLNGMQHVDALVDRFGAGAVLGGMAMISATLEDDGTVRHLNRTHDLVFGELDGRASERVSRLEAVCAPATSDSRASREIVRVMWEKWVFIASAAGITCLMRAPVGGVVAAGAGGLAAALLEECAAIAARNGHAPGDAAMSRARAVLTKADSSLTPSMLGDIQRGARTEADHLLGDLVRRGGVALPAGALLRVAYAHLQAYESGRRVGSGLVLPH